jgi:hypothetical protein
MSGRGSTKSLLSPKQSSPMDPSDTHRQARRLQLERSWTAPHQNGLKKGLTCKVALMPNANRHTVELTDQQIEFIRSSLDLSARAIREHDYGPTVDQAWVAAHRREREDMIASIRTAWGRRSRRRLEPPRS